MKPIVEVKEEVKWSQKKKSRPNKNTMFISDGDLTAIGKTACTLHQNQNQDQSPSSSSSPKIKVNSSKTLSQPGKEKKSEVQEG